jgi:hypothetical protein
MTLPDERYRSVMHTRIFLHELCNPQKTPKVPKHIRETASWLLRHYPSKFDLDMASRTSPDVFAERMEDVTRLFKQYEESKKDET